MRNRIFGAIGVIWGGAILISGILKGGSADKGAYGAGEYLGFIFGGLLFCAGMYFLIKGRKKITIA